MSFAAFTSSLVWRPHLTNSDYQSTVGVAVANFVATVATTGAATPASMAVVLASELFTAGFVVSWLQRCQ